VLLKSPCVTRDQRCYSAFDRVNDVLQFGIPATLLYQILGMSMTIFGFAY
jgi:hypothetical protein